MNQREIFKELSQLRGPTQKFQLIKVFGKAIRDRYSIDGKPIDPATLSTAELMDVISQLLCSELAELAAQARCIDEADYGSDRHTEAFNRFCDAAREMMTETHAEAWDRFSAKATCDEIVHEAMNIVEGECYSLTVRGEG